MESKNKKSNQESEIINCLSNEKIIVRHLPRATELVKDPSHFLYGGMAKNASRTLTVPMNSVGGYVVVLTPQEQSFLEQILGVPEGTMSTYKRDNNYWSDANEKGVNTVVLHKGDNYLDLSNPEDYIRYKILLANTTIVAPSLSALQESPKATYQFVLIKEGDEQKIKNAKVSTIQRSYMEYGKIENDYHTLKFIIETLERRSLSPSSKLEDLQVKADELIRASSKMFLAAATDKLLKTKVLINRSLEKGNIIRKGNFLYLKENGQPLCGENEDPTLEKAALYLNLPKNQEILFKLQASLE